MRRLIPTGAPLSAKAYTKDQTKQILNVGMNTVDRLIDERRLKIIKIGPRNIRVTAESVDALIASGN